MRRVILAFILLLELVALDRFANSGLLVASLISGAATYRNALNVEVSRL
jgi:hypothetical protein